MVAMINMIKIIIVILILMMRNLLTVPPPTKVAPQPVIVGEGFDKSAVRFLQWKTSIDPYF